jgi:uncharacterized membrane protein
VEKRNYDYEPNIYDKATQAIGSGGFIIGLAIALLAYVLWNTLMPAKLVFDGPPFILLNLMLSFIAAFQAPVIMMSQNRQAERDRDMAKSTEQAARNTEHMVEQVKTMTEQNAMMMAQLKEMIQKVEEISEEILEDEEEELRRLGD